MMDWEIVSITMFREKEMKIVNSITWLLVEVVSIKHSKVLFVVGWLLKILNNYKHSWKNIYYYFESTTKKPLKQQLEMPYICFPDPSRAQRRKTKVWRGVGMVSCFKEVLKKKFIYLFILASPGGLYWDLWFLARELKLCPWQLNMVCTGTTREFHTVLLREVKKVTFWHLRVQSLAKVCQITESSIKYLLYKLLSPKMKQRPSGVEFACEIHEEKLCNLAWFSAHSFWFLKKFYKILWKN